MADGHARGPVEAARPAAATPSERLVCIDQFRGLAIMLMVAANYFGGVSGVPNWLKHAPDIGLAPVDLVAPFFIYAIGMTYGLSARRRHAHLGGAATIEHFVRRYLAVMGIGAVMAGVYEFTRPTAPEAWGVLQAIGMAGLIALPFIRLRPIPKFAVGAAMLLGYQYALDRYWVTIVLRASHGGLAGSLGWAAMLIISSGLADLYMARRRRRFFVAVLIVALLGLLAASFWAPLSKNRVSGSYVLVSLAASGALFSVFHWLGGRWRLQVLVAWGQNPLLLYVLHLLLLGLFVLPDDLGWYAMARPWLIAAQLTSLLGLISLVALFMDERGWVYSL